MRAQLQFVFLICLLPATALFSYDPVPFEWERVNPTPQGSFIGLAYGKGKWLAVTQNGDSAFRSADGVHWHDEILGPLFEGPVFYSGGRFFVGSGVSGFSARPARQSVDGIRWSFSSPNHVHEWKGVAFANGRYVVVGNRYSTGQIQTSSDGIEWELVPEIEQGTVWGIATDGARFIAVGSTTLMSNDGQNWETVANHGGTDITFTGAQFIKTNQNGVIHTSLDGLDWERAYDPGGAPPGAYYTRVTHGNGLTLITSRSGHAMVIRDQEVEHVDLRQAWSQDPIDSLALKDIGFGQGRFVAVGTSGGRIYSSADLEGWVEHYEDLGWSVRGLAFGDGEFLATTSSSSVLTSASGSNWTEHPVPWPLAKVAHGNGRFLALTEDPTWIAISEDGRSWSRYESPLTQYEPPTRLVFEQGRFYISNGNVTYVSTNGKEWERLERPPGPSIFYAGKGLWVVQGDAVSGGATDDGYYVPFHYTHDLIHWKTFNLSLSFKGREIQQYLRGSSGANGTVAIIIQQFEGSGKWETSLLMMTEDFKTWSVSRGFYYYGIASAGGRLFLYSAPVAIASTDGTRWRSESNILSGRAGVPLLALGNNRFVGARKNNIWRSPPQDRISFGEWLSSEGLPKESAREPPMLLSFALGAAAGEALGATIQPQLTQLENGGIAATGTIRDNLQEIGIQAEVSGDLIHWQPVSKRPEFLGWERENVQRVTWEIKEPSEVAMKWFFRVRLIMADLRITDLNVYQADRRFSTPATEPLPDSDELVARGEYVFYATITNVGDRPTPPQVIHGVSFWVQGHAVSWSDDFDFSLLPGESRHLRANGGPSGSATWTPSEPGTYEIMGWVDDVGRMEESDETNNQHFGSIYVAPTH